MPTKSSVFKMKFYQLKPEQRRKCLRQKGIKLDSVSQPVLEKLNQLSENVVGQLRLPLSVVPNFVVNGQKFMVPLATEEPSVVAASSKAAGIFAANGGAQARSHRAGIWGQIVLRVTTNFELSALAEKEKDLITEANLKFSSLVSHGGGVRKIDFEQQKELVFLRVLVDPAEAMGANKTNSILEYLAGKLAAFPGVKEKLFAILSNFPSQLTTARVKIAPRFLGGAKTARKIALLSQIAHADVYRAVTNNKGIMNGVDAVLLATGNDYRAVEASTGVWASQSGRYQSLSDWSLKDGYLQGKLTLPLAIGTVGGSINARRDVQQAFALLGGQISSQELAQVLASVGLANNLAAMLAISTEGIQAGHMKLQARNLVAGLKATTAEKENVLKRMIVQKAYSRSEAKRILLELRKGK